MVCDMCGGGGGRRAEEAGGGGADPGYRIKNKNPTQSCGEKTARSLGAKVPATFSGGGEAHRRNGGFQEENH